MARYIPRQRDLLGMVLRLLFLVALFAFAVFVIQPSRGWVWAVIVMLAGVWTLLAFSTRRSGYKCGHCGRVFQIPVNVNFVTQSHVAKNPDGTYFNYKNLTCPRCHHKTKARLMQRSESRGSGALLK